MAGRMPGQRFSVLKADVQDEVRGLLRGGRCADYHFGAPEKPPFSF